MNKLSELQAEAKEDLIILDDEDLHQQSYKNQIIKPKWLDYKSKYRMLTFQLKADHRRLYREKWEYYGGKATNKIYIAKPFDIKVLKTDLGVYISSDDDIIDIELKIEYYETLVQFIEGVIKSIDNRSWDIKHAQDWKKFLAGSF
ncbi:MAG: recombination mediator protein UvsY [Fidelibacterota bacterium]|mgnify:FL=1|jgi:hypothetical protein|tara:strand:+ start:425 stop:859 length:435 start_codon:yes stop_codon:yes gene_type:complete